MSVQNFYELMPKAYVSKRATYKSYNKIKINLPMRMLIIGSSGSGKTNLLLNIISNINAWTKIILVARNTTEPLYAFFIDTIREVERKSKSNILTVGNSIDDVPDVDTFDPKESNLLILDDLISEKQTKLENLEAIFIRGRKQNLSTIFISQSYFKLPIMIRQNASHIVLKKIASVKDLTRICTEYSLAKSSNQMVDMYKKVMSEDGFSNFFMIDLETADEKLRYRKNFEPFEL